MARWRLGKEQLAIILDEYDRLELVRDSPTDYVIRYTDQTLSMAIVKLKYDSVSRKLTPTSFFVMESQDYDGYKARDSLAVYFDNKSVGDAALEITLMLSISLLSECVPKGDALRKTFFIAERAYFGVTRLVQSDATSTRSAIEFFTLCTKWGSWDVEFTEFTNVPEMFWQSVEDAGITVDLTRVSVPQVTVINEGAFENCSTLTTIVAPKARTLHSNAFKNCTALVDIALPVVEVHGTPFGLCHQLETISLNSAEIVSSNVFDGCTSVKTINIAACTEIKGAPADFGADLQALKSIRCTHATLAAAIAIIPTKEAKNIITWIRPSRVDGFPILKASAILRGVAGVLMPAVQLTLEGMFDPIESHDQFKTSILNKLEAGSAIPFMPSAIQVSLERSPITNTFFVFIAFLPESKITEVYNIVEAVNPEVKIVDATLPILIPADPAAMRSTISAIPETVLSIEVSTNEVVNKSAWHEVQKEFQSIWPLPHELSATPTALTRLDAVMTGDDDITKLVKGEIAELGGFSVDMGHIFPTRTNINIVYTADDPNDPTIVVEMIYNAKEGTLHIENFFWPPVDTKVKDSMRDYLGSVKGIGPPTSGKGRTLSGFAMELIKKIGDSLHVKLYTLQDGQRDDRPGQRNHSCYNAGRAKRFMRLGLPVAAKRVRDDCAFGLNYYWPWGFRYAQRQRVGVTDTADVLRITNAAFAPLPRSLSQLRPPNS